MARIFKAPYPIKRPPIHKRMRRGRRPAPMRLIVNGKILSHEESVVFKALSALRIPFAVDVRYGAMGGRVLGGAQIDFLIPPPWNIALEVHGGVHYLVRNRARDIIRKFVRAQLGLRTVIITTRDLPNIYQVLKRILGSVAYQLREEV